jgi:hypothetical protein
MATCNHCGRELGRFRPEPLPESITSCKEYAEWAVRRMAEGKWDFGRATLEDHYHILDLWLAQCAAASAPLI